MYILHVQLILFFWFAFTVEVQLVYRHSTLNLIRNKIPVKTEIEHNRIENPDWQEATCWIITSQGIDVGKTKNKFSNSEQDMNWGQLYCESNMLYMK